MWPAGGLAVGDLRNVCRTADRGKRLCRRELWPWGLAKYRRNKRGNLG